MALLGSPPPGKEPWRPQGPVVLPLACLVLLVCKGRVELLKEDPRLCGASPLAGVMELQESLLSCCLVAVFLNEHWVSHGRYVAFPQFACCASCPEELKKQTWVSSFNWK